MPDQHAFPYIAKATLKYRSPHEQDLTFAKGESIRVLSAAPKREEDDADDDDDDDDDWLVGESLDGSRKGTFPAGFVAYERLDEQGDAANAGPTSTATTSDQLQQQPEAGSQPGAEGLKTESITVPKTSVATQDESGESSAAVAKEDARHLADEDDDLPVPVHASEPVPAPEAIPTSIPSMEFAPPPPLPEPLRATIGQLSLPTDDKPKSQVAETADAPPTPIDIEPTTVVATPPVAITSQPLTTTPKPSGPSSSFRNRIAAFNKPVEPGGAAPPPVPRGKPGGWKRPVLPTEGSAPAPLLPGKPPALANRPVVKPAPPPSQDADKASEPTAGHTAEGAQATTTAAETATSEERKGLSAADAKSSITMSLKERMAALQRGALSPESASDDPTSAPTAGSQSLGASGGAAHPRPPIPGKLSLEKRSIAMLDPGLGPTPPSAALSAISPTTEPISADSAADSGKADAAGATDQASVAGQAPAKQQEGPAEPVGALETTAGGDDGDAAAEPAASTPEEEEAQRRAAIAQRMARLGGRKVGAPGMGMFGQPMPAGGVPPVSPSDSKPSAASADNAVTEDAGLIASDGGTAVEAGAKTSEGTAQDESALAKALNNERSAVEAKADIPAKDETAKSPTSDQVEGAQTLLAVPRRAGPPRRKKGPAPTPPTAAAVAAPSVDNVSEEEAPPSRKTTAENDESPTPALPEESQVDRPVATPLEENLTEPVTREVKGTSLEEQAPESAETELGGEVQPEEAVPPAIKEAHRTTDIGDEEQEATSQDQEDAPSATTPVADQLEEAAEAQDDPEPESESFGDGHRASIVPPRPMSIPPPPPVRPSSVTVPVASPPPLGSRPPLPPMSPAPPVPVVYSADVSKEDQDIGNDAPSEPEKDQQESGIAAAPPSGLVRPQAKLGTTVPLSDAEEKEVAAIESIQEPEQPVATSTEAEAHPETAGSELTEEEEEADRRARIARRMAALGGQRMGALPGMMPAFGAPMPRRTTPKPPGQDDQAARGGGEMGRSESEAAESGPALRSMSGHSPVPGGVVIPGLIPTIIQSGAVVAEPHASEGGAGEHEQVSRLASPPALPTSPPPRLPRAASRSSTQISTGESGSIGRPPSTRPVIPAGMPPPPPPAAAAPPLPPSTPSRLDREEQTNEDEDEAETYEAEKDAEVPPPIRRDSVPALPMSPPPPPPPGKTPPPPARSPFVAPMSPPPPAPSSGGGASFAASAAAAPSAQFPPRQEGRIVSARQNARDLDLMPDSRWWRRGLKNLPPTLSDRVDTITRVNEQVISEANGEVKHIVAIHVLFQDYSQTVVDLDYVDGDAEERYTTLSQRHLFPPVPPDGSTLVKWYRDIGAFIGAQADQLVSTKETRVVGDGSGYALPASLIGASPSRALGPVGASFGAMILHKAGPTVLEAGPDDVRAGDIVVLYGTEFKGKKAALSSYHNTYGSAREPAFGVVVENETKKNKLRIAIQSAGSGGKRGAAGVEEMSLRMDDLRAGVLKAFRVAPAQGWLEDW
ncbi:unnamed protein product [Tilletia laevis]|uniref:SH3 domain-containing protein n=2 Tax=Tilletia TaxID=13289 RepID=A0A177UQU6_9BASI|nr:hypothetical protein CF336_g3896 [Tilletia laevis]KAE8261915.1 hypothetical protein A4X03_0g2865 [Tilletia caries]KAE8203379.1 hypothetical protein CF335_g3042 [Tilletia laevis]CAD6888326.1 unnamed protein product [Tilletia caries]CAD6899593.1 unnamed protein product [Tilletia caries]